MSKVLRLFISSTFEDFRLERAVLQKFVFPEVREVAHKKGLSFLPIDLRWGVSDESQIDQRTMDICLDEVVRASIYPHPDFLILSGDKYGWIPLPRVIEKNEFEKILNKLKELNQDISILKKWYKLDKNQLPPSYILKAKDAENDKDYTIWENWEQVENEIRKLLQLGVNNLDFDTQTKAKYFTSATHEEFKTLLKHKEDKELKEHIFTFIRKFKTINNKKLFDENSDKIEAFRQELKNNTLKDNLKEVEVSSEFYESEFDKQKKDKSYFIENIFEDINSIEEIEESLVYDVLFNSCGFGNEIPIEKQLKITDKAFAKYLIDFANFIQNKLINSIESLNIENLSEENYQKEYKNYILSKPLIARDNEIEEIKEAIKQNNKLLIYGESGVGKSAIMAKVIDDLENENIIYRFCKATPTSSSLVSMLNSILKELGFEIEEKEKNLNDLANSQEDIKKELQEIGYKLNQIDKKTLIIIDAIDQLGSAKIDELEWLPYNDNIKLVISTLNDKNYQDDTEYYQKLKSMISSQIEIKRVENPQEILEKLLEKENRTLTKEQYDYVKNKPDSNKPLYLTIAKEEVKFWQSTDTLTDDKTKETKNTRYLSDTQQEIIKEFFDNLINLHYMSVNLVNQFLIYLFLSDYSLTEDDIIKLMSQDKKIKEEVENKYHKNLTNDLPPAVWSRFRWMIKDYIIENDNGYVGFYHREFDNLKNDIDINKIDIDFRQKIIDKAINNRKQEIEVYNNKKFHTNLKSIIDKYKLISIETNDIIKAQEYEDYIEDIEYELEQNITPLKDLIDDLRVNIYDEDTLNILHKYIENIEEEVEVYYLLNSIKQRTDLEYISKKEIENLNIDNQELKEKLDRIKNNIEEYNKKDLIDCLEQLEFTDNKFEQLKIYFFIKDLRKEFEKIVKENKLNLNEIFCEIIKPLEYEMQNDYYIVKQCGGYDFDIYELLGLTEKNIDNICSLLFGNNIIYISNKYRFFIESYLKYKWYNNFCELFNQDVKVSEIIKNVIKNMDKFFQFLKIDNFFELIGYCGGMNGISFKDLEDRLKILSDYSDESKKIFDKNIFQELHQFKTNVFLLKQLFYKNDKLDILLARLTIIILLELKDKSYIKQEIRKLLNYECIQNDEIIKKIILHKYDDFIDIFNLFDENYYDYEDEEYKQDLESNVSGKRLKKMLEDGYYDENIDFYPSEQEKEIILSSNDNDILANLFIDDSASILLEFIQKDTK